MTEAEKLLRRAKATLISKEPHITYILNGVIFRLHKGTRVKPREIKAVKSKLRQMGLIY